MTCPLPMMRHDEETLTHTKCFVCRLYHLTKKILRTFLRCYLMRLLQFGLRSLPLVGPTVLCSPRCRQSGQLPSVRSLAASASVAGTTDPGSDAVPGTRQALQSLPTLPSTPSIHRLALQTLLTGRLHLPELRRREQWQITVLPQLPARPLRCSPPPPPPSLSVLPPALPASLPSPLPTELLSSSLYSASPCLSALYSLM